MSIPIWSLDETRYKYSYVDVKGTLEEPKAALKKHGPYSRDKFRDVRIGVAMLCPAVHRQVGMRLYKAFQEGLGVLAATLFDRPLAGLNAERIEAIEKRPRRASCRE